MVTRPPGREQEQRRSWAEFTQGGQRPSALRRFVRHPVDSPVSWLLDAIAVLTAMCIGALLARLHIL